MISAVALFHHLDLRVMWSDTDPAGIVWFGVFFRYFEHAEEDLYRRLGSDRTVAAAPPWGVHAADVAAVGVSVAGQAGRRDLDVGVGVSTMSDRRIGFAFDIHERGTGRLICEASYRVACVDAATFATRPFPDEIVSLLAAARATRIRDDGAGSRPRSARRPRPCSTPPRISSIATSTKAAAATSPSSAATPASPTASVQRHVNRCGSALRGARRAARRSRAAAAARRPRVRLSPFSARSRSARCRCRSTRCGSRPTTSM